MKDLGYGKGYQYAHDYEEKVTAMQCLPDNLTGRRYYEPAGLGEEADFLSRLEALRAWKEAHAR